MYGPSGASSHTICEKGALLTSLAMMLDGCKARISGHVINPLSLNEWYVNNNGFSQDFHGNILIDINLIRKFEFTNEG